MIWWPVCAELDGVDAWDATPRGRLRYAVYRRRETARLMGTLALFQASRGQEGAEETAKAMLQLLEPQDEQAQEARERERLREVESFTNMGAIPLSKVKFGNALLPEGQ